VNLRIDEVHIAQQLRTVMRIARGAARARGRPGLSW